MALNFDAARRTLLVVAAVLASGAHADELTSAAINAAIFKEGEIQRSQRQFGAWTLVCDEVKSLHQRFCSLYTEPQDASGAKAANLVISTGDDGKPAALLRTPVGVNIASGLQIVLDAPAAKGRLTPASTRHIDYLRCESGACVLIWRLSQAELSALNAGAAMRLRFERVREIPLFAAHIASSERSLLVEAVARGDGFSAAVGASLK